MTTSTWVCLIADKIYPKRELVDLKTDPKKLSKMQHKEKMIFFKYRRKKKVKIQKGVGGYSKNV